MESQQLCIAVDNLIGVPKVTIRGRMAGWHDQAMSGVLSGFRDQGASSLVLDIAGLNFVGTSGAASMIDALRKLGPEMCVHVVASGLSAKILERADLGPSVRLYSSTDEIAQHIAPESEDLTSRWMPDSFDDTEMPLAA